MWTRDAPASNASCVDSTCSATVIGTAGLSVLRGTEPVIATARTTGLMLSLPFRSDEGDCVQVAMPFRDLRGSWLRSFYVKPGSRRLGKIAAKHPTDPVVRSK